MHVLDLGRARAPGRPRQRPADDTQLRDTIAERLDYRVNCVTSGARSLTPAGRRARP